MKKSRIKTMCVTAVCCLTAAMIFMTGCGEDGGLKEELATVASDAADAADAKKEETTEEATEEKKEQSKDTKEDKAEKKEEIKYPDSDYAGEIDEQAPGLTVFRTRANDKKSGDPVDTSVYKDSKGKIVKIMTEDYGSDGRMVMEYYYHDDEVVFVSRHKTDIFGAGDDDVSAALSAEDDKYFTGVAEELLSKAQKDKGNAYLYGYIGDEQGGVTANVQVDLRNVAGDFKLQTKSNEDGFYSFEVPQEGDTYNVSFTYADHPVSSINDIHVVPGTPEYSLGRMYTAPQGHAVHDTDVYLLNINAKAPEELGDGEYLAVVSSEYGPLSLKLVNKDSHERSTGSRVKMDMTGAPAGYALYAEDTANIGEDDMNGSIGTSGAVVTIYDKSGIRAAFVAPAGRLGSLWKVCDVDDKGVIAVSGLMFSDTKGWK